jgi:hypothetical protein
MEKYYIKATVKTKKQNDYDYQKNNEFGVPNF